MTQTANPRELHSILPAVILGGCILGLALGARHVQGLFLVPITMDRSWPREVFGFAVALQNLVWGLSQPFTGMLADRFGSAKVIATGIVLYALGLAGMATSSGAAGFTLSAGFVVGVALACTSFGLVYGALSRIVPESRRAWALATAAAIAGLAQFLMVPGAQAFIQNLGWAGALLALAALVAVLLPASAVLKDRVDEGPGKVRSGPDSIRRAVIEAFQHRGFLLLNAGFLACGFQLAFIATHLPAYILDRGLPAGVAVNGLAIVAFANIFGAYWCGVLGGLYRPKNVLAWTYVARSVAIAAFVAVPLTAVTVYVFCVAMGFVWLGTVPLTNGLVSQVFGVRYISTLFGFVFLGHQIGAFAGAWLGGAVFDATGSYTPVWTGAIVLGLLAALLHAPINDAAVERLAPRAVA